jgi:light-regulated signal transduction histidine kinase (bacteriophytochrome)
MQRLINNALKFVSPGRKPHVTIRAELINDHTRIWFEDNGVGIAKEDQTRIFRMFERIFPDSDFEGTGIGLTIVRKAVDRMGGSIPARCVGAPREFVLHLYPFRPRLRRQNVRIHSLSQMEGPVLWLKHIASPRENAAAGRPQGKGLERR